MLSLIKKHYLVEMFLLALALYLFGAFVHLSFNIAYWSIFTRTALAALFIALVLYSQYIAALTGLKK